MPIGDWRFAGQTVDTVYLINHTSITVTANKVTLSVVRVRRIGENGLDVNNYKINELEGNCRTFEYRLVREYGRLAGKLFDEKTPEAKFTKADKETAAGVILTEGCTPSTVTIDA